MSPEELYQGLVDSYSALSSFDNSLKRGLRTFVKTRSMFSTGIAFLWNYDSYKTITKGSDIMNRLKKLGQQDRDPEYD